MTQFYQDVMQGLTSTPKYLQSKYFYDAVGDKLFQQIMDSPEYYLTNCEREIFAEQTNELAQTITHRFKEFDIVELGAGDAVKSTHLLKQLKEEGYEYTYYPIDISKNVLHLLEKEMPRRITGISIQGLNGDYFEMIRQAYTVSPKRKVVLFLGANIGNFIPQEAERFLQSLHHHLMPGDLVLIGFDLKKNPKQIRAAYNDKGGITKAFNLNLLNRINRELGADFDLNAFDHYPTYDPVTGACRSFLISLQSQQVSIADTEIINFAAYEPIYMELSQKYTVAETNTLATHTGFRPLRHFYDSHQWFVDAVWERKE